MASAPAGGANPERYDGGSTLCGWLGFDCVGSIWVKVFRLVRRKPVNDELKPPPPDATRPIGNPLSLENLDLGMTLGLVCLDSFMTTRTAGAESS